MKVLYKFFRDGYQNVIFEEFNGRTFLDVDIQGIHVINEVTLTPLEKK